MKHFSFLLLLLISIQSIAQQYIPLAQTYSGEFGKAGKGELVIYCSGYNDYGDGPSPSFEGKANIDGKEYTIFGSQRSDGQVQLDLNENGNQTVYILEIASHDLYLGTMKGLVYDHEISGKKLGKINLVQDIARDDLYEGYFSTTSASGETVNVGFTYYNGTSYVSMVATSTADDTYATYGAPEMETETTIEFEQSLCKYLFRWEDGQLTLLTEGLSGSESCQPAFGSNEKVIFKKL